MNYLAHFYYANIKENSQTAILQPQNKHRIVGHYLGDFIKGRVNSMDLNADFIQGIVMHRELDLRADNKIIHLLQSTDIHFHKRRYLGITFDMACDHFLSTHWHEFSDISIYEFSESQIKILKEHKKHLPENALWVLNRMEQYQWLTNYHDLNYLEKSFDGIQGRLSRKNSIGEAFLDITDNYIALEKTCLEFLRELKKSYSV